MSTHMGFAVPQVPALFRVPGPAIHRRFQRVRALAHAHLLDFAVACLLAVAVAGLVASATVTWLVLADPGRVVQTLAEDGARALVSMVLDALREVGQRLRPLL
jgi:hypothetical protein